MKRPGYEGTALQIALILASSASMYLAETPFFNFALMFFFPVIWFNARGRVWAYLAAAAYYLTAAHGLVATTSVYLGLTSYREIVSHLALVWAGSSLTLALPWGVLWTGKDSGWKAKTLRLALILVLLIIPPLGLWGWANPLLSAGHLFPYTREAGLIGVFSLWLALWVLSGAGRRRLYYAACAAVFAYAAFMSPASRLTVKTPPDWYGARTSFGMMLSGSSSELSVYMRHRHLAELIAQTPAKYVVLPETVAGNWNENTELLWGPTTAEFFQMGRTYFVGAEVFLPGNQKYYNVAQIRGANNRTVRQRFPVTYSAWRPFSDSGAIANWFGDPGIVLVDDLRVGLLICFEPFLYLPGLTTMASRPDVLVVCSNHWWCRNSNISLLSDKLCASWALLYDVPLVLAKNS
jgi:hypothetical protein